MKNEDELWVGIDGTNEAYQISNFGRIRSFLKQGSRRVGEKDISPKILATPKNGNGYNHTTIRFIEHGVTKSVRIHKLVAKYFVENPNKYNVVLHIDDNKQNNFYKNLKWGTSLENNRDAFAKGLIKPAVGEKRKKSNLTNRDVLDILKSTDPYRSIAKRYGVNHTCISDIKTGRTWNHITGLQCTRKFKPNQNEFKI